MEKTALIITFANPQILWLAAIVVPVLSFFLWRGWKRRQFLIRQFVQARLLPLLTVGVSQKIQKTRLFLLVIAVALCLLALARPQWGFAWEEARQQGVDIVVAVDTSRSMLAGDLQPDRLTRAKLAALDLMRLAKSDRLGLVAFAGTAFLQCPLTLDDEAFRQSVNILDVGVIPQGGTALTEAIDTATNAFKDEADNHKVLVLFTDGEDHEQGAVEAARKAAEAGLRIFTVGVGTPNGDILRERNETGELVYVKDSDGNVIKSRLNETLLTEIATVGNGFYLPMSGSQVVEVLYQRGIEPLPKTEVASKLVRRYREQYHWFLAGAIALLLIEMFLSDRKKAVRPSVSSITSNEPLKAALVLFLAAFCLSPVQAASSKALRNYQAGKYEEAEQQFQQLLQRRPDDPRLHYNTGTAAYQAGHFERATKHFDAAARSDDLDLQQSAFYNLGNTFYRLGEQNEDPKQKISTWEAALKQYQAALKLNPNDPDAQFNHEFLKQRLEELKKQQQQQQQSQDQNQQKDSDQKDQSKQDPSDPNESEDRSDPKEQKSEQEKRDQKNQNQNQQPEQPQDQSESKDKPNTQQNQNGSDSKKDPEQGKQEKPDARPEEQSNTSKDTAKPSGDAAPDGQMTIEQAKRLLDAQKGEEKSMLFVPPQSKRKVRVFKNW